MGWLKDNLSNLPHLLSKDNDKSRGFYIGVVAAWALILIGAIVLEVLACLGKTKGTLQLVGYFAPLIALIVIIGTIWMCRDRDSY